MSTMNDEASRKKRLVGSLEMENNVSSDERQVRSKQRRKEKCNESLNRHPGSSELAPEGSALPVAPTNGQQTGPRFTDPAEMTREASLQVMQNMLTPQYQQPSLVSPLSMVPSGPDARFAGMLSQLMAGQSTYPMGTVPNFSVPQWNGNVLLPQLSMLVSPPHMLQGPPHPISPDLVEYLRLLQLQQQGQLLPASFPMFSTPSMFPSMALQNYATSASCHGLPMSTISPIGQSHLTNAASMTGPLSSNSSQGTSQSLVPSIPTTATLCLPVPLAVPSDTERLSCVQVWLRFQIEAFQATAADVSTHTRGRNKSIKVGQVGIRCRHCAQRPILQRAKGSTYFPNSVFGYYQASQNMCQVHFQNGVCRDLPEPSQREMERLVQTTHKGANGSKAGRAYWAETAQQLGLVDTDWGVFFVRDVPPGVRLLTNECSNLYRTSSSLKHAPR